MCVDKACRLIAEVHIHQLNLESHNEATRRRVRKRRGLHVALHLCAGSCVIAARSAGSQLATAINTVEEVSDVRFKFAYTHALETSRLHRHEVSGHAY